MQAIFSEQGLILLAWSSSETSYELVQLILNAVLGDDDPLSRGGAHVGRNSKPLSLSELGFA